MFMERGEPVLRTSEIEDVTNLYFIHPISSRLTPLLAALRVTPNAVSLAGMLFGVLAGFAYTHYQDMRYTIAGFVLMIAWHVMDGADGQLARLTHSQSEFGKILDGICDYVTFCAVYLGLAITLSRQHGDWVWLLIIVSGVCHAVQSAAYENQREAYNFWARGRKSAPLSPKSSRLLAVYVRVQFLAAGGTVEFHKKLAAVLEARPASAGAIRQRYREVFAPAVRRWSVLSANYRTLGIFICALLKAPLVYFWFEIFGFSAILVVLLVRQHGRYEVFLARE